MWAGSCGEILGMDCRQGVNVTEDGHALGFSSLGTFECLKGELNF
jgi:hypothetical protein